MRLNGKIEIVAEIGQCAGNSPELFIEHARAAKEAGCGFVKAQILDPARLTVADSPVYWETEHQAQHEAFGKFGIITRELWPDIADECRKLGIRFAATPFDLGAVTTICEAGVAFIKIASGDITYKKLIQECAESGYPIVLSTGASSTYEINQALEWIGYRNYDDLTLLACTLCYPTEEKYANLNRIETLSVVFGYPVGYSDHTEGVYTGLAAAACGARVLEKHFSLGRGNADDDAMALRPWDMKEYVRLAKRGHAMYGDGKLGCMGVEAAAKKGARRGVYAARDLEGGKVIEAGDLAVLRPARGAHPQWEDEFIGSVVLKDFKAGEPYPVTFD